MADMEIKTGNKELDEGRQRWKYVRECKSEKEFRKGSTSDAKYFTGEDQGWDEDNARAQLIEEGRPAVTLNRVSAIYRLICGARPKTEAKFSAVEEGDLETADILGSCKEHVEDNSMWQFHEGDWFMNGLLLRRGIVEIVPDYNSDPRGDIKLKLHKNSHKFYFDPDAQEKDRSDGMYMFRVENIDPKQAKRKWPKLTGRIDELVDHVQSGESAYSGRDSGLADEYQDPRSNYYDAVSKKIKVIYYYYKEKTLVNFILDTVGGTVFESPKSKEEIEKDLAASAAPERFKVIEREFTDVKYLIFSHDIEFERGDNPWDREDGRETYLSKNFWFLCFEPERLIAGAIDEIRSIGEDLKDPQKYHNKLASHILAIIGTTAHSGWEYEKSAISTEEKKKLKKHGSKPGVNIEWNDGALTGNKTRKIQPGTPPNAQIVEAREMAREILDISGAESLVSTESLGKGASGKAIALKQTQGGNIISWVYESYRFFQHVLAMFERDAIQTIYNYEKVIRIKGTKPQFIRINENIYDERGAISQILNDVTTGKYDIKTTDKELFPSERVERFHDFVELVRSGALPLPPEVLIKIVMHLLDDPDLKEIVEQEFGQYLEAARQAQLEAAAQGELAQAA